MGLKGGDACFFTAGNPDKFYKFAGSARNKVGSELGLIDENAFAFAWIVDFPMYEYNEDEKKVDFSHNPFSMPQGGLEGAERGGSAFDQGLPSTTSPATGTSSPPAASTTTGRKRW